MYQKKCIRLNPHLQYKLIDMYTIKLIESANFYYQYKRIDKYKAYVSCTAPTQAVSPHTASTQPYHDAAAVLHHGQSSNTTPSLPQHSPHAAATQLPLYPHSAPTLPSTLPLCPPHLARRNAAPRSSHAVPTPFRIAPKPLRAAPSPSQHPPHSASAAMQSLRSHGCKL